MNTARACVPASATAQADDLLPEVIGGVDISVVCCG